MNETGRRQIFSGMQILINREWHKHQALIIEDNLIQAIIPEEMIQHHLPAKHHEFHKECYLAPGLIDLHIHGAHGKDVMDGTEDALLSISKALAAEGVTSFLATTMTGPVAQIEIALQTVANAMLCKEGAAILGVHLEGPFISKEKAGAQAKEYVQLPDSALIQEWQNRARGAIKIVTLAPEMPGALDFIQTLRQMNVIASIGHSNATYQETCAAIDAGCTQATHLFNGLPSIHQREPGPVVALLLNPLVSVELIVDGVHLHPAIVELCFRLKGREHLLLVTDAMRAKCLRDGYYELGGQQVEARSGQVFLNGDILAGSTLRMPDAIKNMVKFSRCLLSDAINMATYNPAHVLGLDKFRGTITVGKLADLVIFDGDLKVLMTVREGRQIYRA